MQYFDYKSVADQVGIPADKLVELEAQVRADFPADDMMFELHMLRVCMAIRDGHTTLSEVPGGEL